jgi:phage-related protein
MSCCRANFEAIGGGLYALRLSLAHNEFRCLFGRSGHFDQILVALMFLAKKNERLGKVVKTARKRLSEYESQSKGG